MTQAWAHAPEQRPTAIEAEASLASLKEMALLEDMRPGVTDPGNLFKT